MCFVADRDFAAREVGLAETARVDDVYDDSGS